MIHCGLVPPDWKTSHAGTVGAAEETYCFVCSRSLSVPSVYSPPQSWHLSIRDIGTAQLNIDGPCPLMVLIPSVILTTKLWQISNSHISVRPYLPGCWQPTWIDKGSINHKNILATEMLSRVLILLNYSRDFIRNHNGFNRVTHST